MLYRSFVTSIHTILPLIHLETFKEEYESFWCWIATRDKGGPASGLLADNPSFLPLLFAVLFGGASSCSSADFQSHFRLTARNDASSQLCEAAMRTQTLVAFPRSPTIYSLTSFLIVQNLLLREEEPLASCSYISVALRVAQAMGLHRDGSNFDLPPIEAEMRRRIWWHIIHTDVMTSVSSALPPSCLSDTTYDTMMVSESKENHIGTFLDEPTLVGMGQLGQGQRIYPLSVDLNALDVRLMVAVDRYSITSMLRRILRRQFDITPLSKDDFTSLRSEVDMLHSRIRARTDQLRTICERKRSDPSLLADDFDEPVFTDWAERLLKLMVHKTYCVLFQPLVRASGHSLWTQVRTE